MKATSSTNMGVQKRNQSIAASRQQTSPYKVQHKDIENCAGEVPAEEPDDSSIVCWDGDNDPETPMNFNTWSKALNMTIVAVMTFVVALGFSMVAPGVLELGKDFKNDKRICKFRGLGVYPWICG